LLTVSQILHVLTASLEHAQLILRCGLQAGFRESGAINLTAGKEEPATPIVAIRSMGLALESLVGRQTGGDTQCVVTPDYLWDLVSISNDRFAENKKRIDRFRAAIRGALEPPMKDGHIWEDVEVRRERKKAEGLRRKAELKARERHDETSAVDDGLDMPLNTTEFT
jgi:tRNA wybutosine-synthesizing protein 3